MTYIPPTMEECQEKGWNCFEITFSRHPDEPNWDEYYRQHAVCPMCGTTDQEVTTMGPLPVNGTLKDMNHARCRCGWVGRVDDMVPERKHEGPR